MRATAPIKLAAIGGGTGLSTLLEGLKSYIKPPAPQISLTAIVTVTDNGNSSGRLRDEFAVLPPGDLRNCLVALSNEDALMTRLFRHRFPGQGALGGHALGNLIILALNQLSGNFFMAIEQAREMLGINARVLPSTLDRVDLAARVGNRVVKGQVAIKQQPTPQTGHRAEPIHELALIPPDARALPAAVEAILQADLITLGPGSLFTSVIANLLVTEIAQALAVSKARKIYICNAMTEFNETDGYSAMDHVRQVVTYAPELRLDYALFNSAPISTEMRERYAAEKAVALEPPSEPAVRLRPDSTEIKLVSWPLASESRFVRHDPKRLSQAIFEIYSR
ncbi:MAG TPA: gluconeogenesis factor YvcK family protein [Blastocatellia bacterium]|nr:gluconeogenesis factor YvcK family protein [Blastocatellia bacterium]